MPQHFEYNGFTKIEEQPVPSAVENAYHKFAKILKNTPKLQIQIQNEPVEHIIFTIHPNGNSALKVKTQDLVKEITTNSNNNQPSVQ